MVRIGYTLSAEEFGAPQLVDFAVRAEATGFTFARISDHYLPWAEAQGQSPFAWTVLGAIARATSRIELGTGVTCPLIRYHPALVAQMAATTASLLPGRFTLGLGAGEFLNEHVYGDAFPPPDIRHEMLEEAIDLIRTLWSGDWEQFHGKYYEAQEARIFSLPDRPVPIHVAASGPNAARLAARFGDGMIATAPDPDLVRAYRAPGGNGPIIGQLSICWAPTEQQAARIAREAWPTAAIHGDATWDIRSTRLFDQLTQSVTEDEVAKIITCGPDPRRHLQAIERYVSAGFDSVYLHQVGKNQEGFFRFCERELLPAMVSQQAEPAAAAGRR